MEKKPSTESGAHILVFPFPAQGHMLPLLYLTHQLSLKGLTITVLITPGNLHILKPLLTADPSIQTLIFPFPKSPLILDGVENVKDIGNLGNALIISALRELQGPIIEWFSSNRNPPVVIFSDFFLGWTHYLALELKIPRITFYSSGAFLAASFGLLWRNVEALELGRGIKFDDLPGTPNFRWEQIPSVFRRYIETLSTGTRDEFLKNSMVANTLSWASVFNTFEALEDEFLSYLRKTMDHPRVFSVGPLHLTGGYNESGCGSDEKVSLCDRVLSWLDRFEDESVLYVCFGSQKLLKNAQMEALADGLESSGVKFVWVVKSATVQQAADGYGSMPNGFENRVEGRGYILKGWAPQSSILNHRAVGGFLSHCGWNSVLEAITSNALILCWPMEADQFVDEKLMVDYRGAAVRLCEGSDTVPDSAKLAQTIAKFMHEDVIEKSRLKELKNKALEALKVDGSSSKDLDRLVQGISQLKKLVV